MMDERAALSSPEAEASFREEVLTIFRESLGLVRSTLTTRYGLGEESARKLEDDLLIWFFRFCERPGAAAPRDSRHSLLVMACVFARGVQRERIESGALAPDPRLARTLERDPTEVAREVSRPLKLLYRKLHE